MKNYSEMTNQEFAFIICDFYDRVEQLAEKIQKFQKGDLKGKREIQSEYKALKEEIKGEAHDVKLSINNELKRKNLVFRCYSESVWEAGAFGLTRPSNSEIDEKFSSAVSTAKYELGKYIDIDEWRKLLKGSEEKPVTVYPMERS